MVSFKDMGISGKLMALMGVFVAGMSLFGVVALTTLSAVKIGSSLYQTIETGNDLEADFAPPVASLLPSDFLIYRMLASHDRNDIRNYTTKFEEARKEFENRTQFWLSHLTDGELKDIVKKTREPADQFFQLARMRSSR